jgi:hypothetical protein
MKNPRGIARLRPPLAPTRTRVRSANPAFQAKWTQSEDKRLIELAANVPNPNWNSITANLPGKTVHQVVDRWEKVVNPSLIKGSWTRDEDEMIINWVKANGPTNWTKLAENMPGRIGKQCRERWHNGLNPDLVRTTWLPQEDQVIEKFQQLWGNKWSRIADLLPGRTDNAVKNRWNSTLKRKIQNQVQPQAAPVVKAIPAPALSLPPLELGFADDPVELITATAPSIISPTGLEFPPGGFELDWNQMGNWKMGSKIDGIEPQFSVQDPSPLQTLSLD